MAVDRTRERLVEELTPPLLASGFDLEAVEVTPAGRRRLVKATLTDGHDVTGRILEAGETDAVLETDEGRRTVSFGEVAKARIQVEFNRKEG